MRTADLNALRAEAIASIRLPRNAVLSLFDGYLPSIWRPSEPCDLTGAANLVPDRTMMRMAGAARAMRRVTERLSRLLRSLALTTAAPSAGASSGSTSADGAPSVTLTAKQERAWTELVKMKKYFVVVLDHKGGIGKSLMVQIAYETLSAGPNKTKNKVLVLDADFVNKNMQRLGLATSANVVQASRADFEGFLFEAAEQIEQDQVHGVVVDSAAGSEENFHRHLPQLAKYLQSFGARLIVIRPMTTNPLNQDNCVNFGRKTMTDDMGVVMVRNFGQGREKEDFRIWMESDERKEMFEIGMVECDLEMAGALCSDLAAACKISVADIATKTLDEMQLTGRRRQIGMMYFDRRFKLFVARWMARQTVTFEKAFANAVLRTFQ